MAATATAETKKRQLFNIREAKLSGALTKRINDLADCLADLPVDEFRAAPRIVKTLRDFALTPTAIWEEDK